MVSKDSKLYKLFLQFFKFGLVGISNSLISLAVYYLFLWINPDLYLIGQTVGFIVSVLNSYILNKKFVFKNRENTSSKKTLVKTYLAYGATFALGIALIYIMVNFLNISKAIAPIINIAITTPINFIINRVWVHK